MITDKTMYIAITPVTDEQEDWDGHVKMSILTPPNTNLNEEDKLGMNRICTFMCAALNVAEDSQDVRDAVYSYIDQQTANDDDDDTITCEVYEQPDLEKHVSERQGNVVKVEFNSKRMH